MVAQKGKDLLLKIGDGAGGFGTVAGLRARSLVLGSASVDVTHADSAGRWRELLAGAGLRRASLAGSGVFRDAESDAPVRQLFFDDEIRAWQVVVPELGTLQGPFQITSLEYRGDHQGELTFDLAVESAGEIAFTATA
jgi:TP901-1 family phage major tail protein